MIVPQDESLLPAEYRLYNYRYLMAFIYFIINLLLSVMANQFLAIQTTLENIYSSSTYIINFTTTLANYVANIPVIFLANYIIDKYGIRVSIYIGSILTLLSLWIRCLSDASIIAILIGQTICALAASFVSAPQKISVNWFHSSERALWTTIMIQGLNIGTGLGSKLSGYVPDNISPEEGRTKVYNFMFYTAIVGTVITIFCCIFVKEKPKMPPSPAAVQKKQPFWFSVRILFSSWEKFFALLGSSVYLGGVITFVSTFQIIVSPLGVQTDQIGTAFLIANIPGFFGALLISGYAAKSGELKKVLFGSGVVTSASIILIYFASVSANTIYLTITTSIFAFFLQPILPMLLELLCELSYPAGEAVSAGMLFIFGNIFGVGGSFLIDAIMSNKDSGEAISSFLIIIGFILVGMILVFTSRAKLERSLKEHGSFLSVSHAK